MITSVRRLALGMVVVVAGLGAMGPAHAACGAPFLITSVDPNDTSRFSYVYSAGLQYGDGIDGASVTQNLDGFFWAVGRGDVALGVGADNGSFAALDWMLLYPQYPASLLTTWAASTGIDTCIDEMGPLGQRCMAMVLTDFAETDVVSSFALLSAPDDPASGDFSFAQVANIPIQLIPMAAMPILHTTLLGSTGIEAVLRGPTDEVLLNGTYVSEADPCQVGLGKSTDPFNGLILGYKLYRQVLGRGANPPADLRREAWEDVGGDPIPLNAPVSVQVMCQGDTDVYLAYSLVFDGGFETSVVSTASTRIECGPNVADPEPRYRERDPGRQGPTDRRR